LTSCFLALPVEGSMRRRLKNFLQACWRVSFRIPFTRSPSSSIGLYDLQGLMSNEYPFS
jgi:hypothetical protein